MYINTLKYTKFHCLYNHTKSLLLSEGICILNINYHKQSIDLRITTLIITFIYNCKHVYMYMYIVLYSAAQKYDAILYPWGSTNYVHNGYRCVMY